MAAVVPSSLAEVAVVEPFRLMPYLVVVEAEPYLLAEVVVPCQQLVAEVACLLEEPVAPSLQVEPLQLQLVLLQLPQFSST